MKTYPSGNYPVFEGYDHMQYQIRDPKGFAEMLAFIAEQVYAEAAVYQKARGPDMKYKIEKTPCRRR